MPLLLCAATEFEIAITRHFLHKHPLQKEVTVLITGVGLTAAIYQLTKAIYTIKPHLILQAGVAGSFNDSFSLAAVAVVENEMIGDSGVEENGHFHSLFDMNLSDPNLKPWHNKTLPNKNKELLKATGLPIAHAVTVNEITTANNRISYYKNELGASLESLEGAALHYVALAENIPFLQLRAVSNFVGERDKKRWALDKAINALNSELQQQLLKLI